MSRGFNDLEGLCIAMEMERRGEDFYRRAAQVSRTQEMVDLLESLAADEQRHCRSFAELYEAAGADKGNEPYDAEASAYLSALAAEIAFPDGLMALRRKGFEDAAAVLEVAIQSEQDSILFYSELSARCHDRQTRATFEEIASQERGHLEQLKARLAALR